MHLPATCRPPLTAGNSTTTLGPLIRLRVHEPCCQAQSGEYPHAPAAIDEAAQWHGRFCALSLIARDARNHRESSSARPSSFLAFFPRSWRAQISGWSEATPDFSSKAKLSLHTDATFTILQTKLIRCTPMLVHVIFHCLLHPSSAANKSITTLTML